MIRIIVLSLLAWTVSAAAHARFLVGDLDGIDPALRSEIRDWEERYQAAKHDYLQRLVGQGDSRSLMVAALLYDIEPLPTEGPDSRRQGQDRSRITAWVQRALQTEAVPAVVLWLAANRCRQAEAGCDRGLLLERLSQTDGDNAWVWLERAELALAHGDSAGADLLFERAVTAPRHDAYDRAVGRMLLDAYAGFQPPPWSDEMAEAVVAQWSLGLATTPEVPFDPKMVELMGYWMMHAMPTWSLVTRFCPSDDEARARSPATRDDQCRRLLTDMRESDNTFLGEAVTLGLLIHRAADEAEASRWREAYRQWMWRYQSFAELAQASASGFALPGHIERMLRDGEQAAVAHAMAAVGIEPEASDDWLPDDPALRQRLELVDSAD